MVSPPLILAQAGIQSRRPTHFCTQRRALDWQRPPRLWGTSRIRLHTLAASTAGSPRSALHGDRPPRGQIAAALPGSVLI
jgi:hypothetical protein